MKKSYLSILCAICGASLCGAIYDKSGGRDQTAAAFAVKPGIKYDLIFMARNLDDRNDHDVNTANMNRMVYYLRFFAADGKDMEKNRMPFTRLRRRSIPFGDMRCYVTRFYAPQGAAKMELRIEPSATGGGVEINNPELKNAPDEGAINVNPEFKLGKDNLSGWDVLNPRGGMIFTAAAGKVCIDTGYGSGTEYFPLTGEGTYRFTVKSLRYGGYTEALLQMFDRNGKQIDKVGVFAYPNGRFREFVKRPEVVAGRLLIYDNIVESVKVERIGDAAIMRTIMAEQRDLREKCAKLKELLRRKDAAAVLALCEDVSKSERLQPDQRFTVLESRARALLLQKNYVAAEKAFRTAAETGLYGGPDFDRRRCHQEICRILELRKDFAGALAHCRREAARNGVKDDEREFFRRQEAGVMERSGDLAGACKLLTATAHDATGNLNSRLAAAKHGAWLFLRRGKAVEGCKLLRSMHDVPGVAGQAMQSQLFCAEADILMNAKDYAGARKALGAARDLRQSRILWEIMARRVELAARENNEAEMLRQYAGISDMVLLSEPERERSRREARNRVQRANRKMAVVLPTK